ncbi:hypothetical protein SASPL_123895 [Salvia splendens]|uniref:Phospholipase/carboxylesterase/thioesterase domain-containing protein n=1 Tax=Salvia splendens TaxID=180675 RepID=A0A8X8XQQ8_SALSN|nr:hypothetical protein SASPL_123895 [Salvia splendens]
MKAVKKIHGMIDKEIAAGTNPNNVFICGFSQGGALTLASIPKTLGGGATVPFNSSILQRVKEDAKKLDKLVLPFSKEMAPTLLALGHSLNSIIWNLGSNPVSTVRPEDTTCHLKHRHTLHSTGHI